MSLENADRTDNVRRPLQRSIFGRIEKAIFQRWQQFHRRHVNVDV